MASLRNLAISALRIAGHTNIDAALRWTARDPARPLSILGLTRLCRGPACTAEPHCPTPGTAATPMKTIFNAENSVLNSGSENKRNE